jgi:uncharacterized 2Fe-2S/4Fe-4S cluster protein (DUF4445 family)
MEPTMKRILHVLGPGEGSSREVETQDGSLAQALFLSGHFLGRPLCSGLGRCGECRVQFLSTPPEPKKVEQELLSAEEILSGFRLACRHEVRDEAVLAVAPSGGIPPALPKALHGPGLTLAVDLGTTAIKWSFQGKGKGAVQGAEPNPQMGAGSEVMSRLSFALQERRYADYLRKAVVSRLEELVRAVGGVDALAISGNSVMLHLLLGAQLDGLARSPYRLTLHGGTMEQLSDTLPHAYIPPLLGPFIGADISAGLCSLLLNGSSPEYPFLFCDLGTNGELVLGMGPEHFLATSVALGPALEGVGLSMGALAGPDVVSGFTTGPNGIVPEHGAEGARISGTGYLSLLAGLKRLGIIDEQGTFRRGDTPLARRIMQGFDPATNRLDISGGRILPAADVEEVLKVKAAFNAGTASLLREGGLAFREIGSIFLAGTLGEHVRIGDMLELGFFAGQAGPKIVKVGNTSLKGAALLLADMGARERAELLREQVKIIELTGDPGFQHRFIRAMRFTHIEG